ncbi:MAG: glycosyltransferase [Calditrichaeota bacterium]|nr:glycosyltransferase [Calditrichota bacterium]
MLCNFYIIFILFYAAIIAGLLPGIGKARRRIMPNFDTWPDISIIVPVRDGEETISQCVNALVVQDYPGKKLEILVVDDHSRDRSLEITNKLASQYSFVKVLENEKNGKWQSSKKSALEVAVANASGTILLFTDADCVPPRTWARAMVSCFSKETGLIAGFSPQRAAGEKMWNGFLFLDSLAAAFVAAAGIGWGRGITCAGRNLAVRTEALRDVEGYRNTPDSLSGDDDFLLQAISKSRNWQVGYCFEPASFVNATGPKNLKHFIRQKQRHISAGKHYSFYAQLGFGGFHFLNYLLWISAFAGIFVDARLIVPLVIKIVIDYGALGYLAGQLKRTVPFCSFCYWEILFPLYNALASPVAFFRKISW